MWIFLFVELVHWFFSSLNWFCSWSLLRIDLLFMELSVCRFFFVKLIARWFFFRETCSKLVTLIFSPGETDFLYEILCVLNFYCCWNLLHLDFCSCILLCTNFCSWNLLHADFFFVIFPFMRLLNKYFLLVKLILFMEFFAFLFILVRGTCCVLTFVRETCSRVDFSLHETCTLVFLLVILILLMEVVKCLFVRRTDFAKELVPSWFIVHETCCMLIFSLRETST